jgi:hypothetical protein
MWVPSYHRGRKGAGGGRFANCCILERVGEEKKMSDVVDSLIFDLLEFVAKGERSYAEVMEAWRTSCPKLPVWEDANDRGLIASELKNGREVIRITPAGLALLEKSKTHKKLG